MNRKKILIIIIAVFVLFALLLFIFSRKKIDNDEIVQTETENAISSESKTEFIENVSVSVEAGTDIKGKFTEFASSQQKEPLKTAKMNDSENESIPLDEFTHSVGAKIRPDLNNILNQTEYDLISCNDSGRRNYGIILNISLMPEYKGNIYQDEVKFMRSWEKSLLVDTAGIIFPQHTFTQNQLNQSLIFSDDKYRFATIRLPDNTIGMIVYYLVDDYIVISSSKECLKKASEYVFSTYD